MVLIKWNLIKNTITHNPKSHKVTCVWQEFVLCSVFFFKNTLLFRIDEQHEKLHSLASVQMQPHSQRASCHESSHHHHHHQQGDSSLFVSLTDTSESKSITSLVLLPTRPFSSEISSLIQMPACVSLPQNKFKNSLIYVGKPVTEQDTKCLHE